MINDEFVICKSKSFILNQILIIVKTKAAAPVK